MNVKVIVSACLLGENTKYNGSNNKNEELLKLLKGHEIISVCPEVFGGLPIPRYPAEIRDSKVINSHHEDVTNEYIKGANFSLKKALDNNAKLAILQSRSPSCGYLKIYNGTFSKKLIDGNGIFVQFLLKNNIEVIDVSDMKKIREKLSHENIF